VALYSTSKHRCCCTYYRKIEAIWSASQVFCSTVFPGSWCPRANTRSSSPGKVQPCIECRIRWRASDTVSDTWWVRRFPIVARQSWTQKSTGNVCSYAHRMYSIERTCLPYTITCSPQKKLRKK
jgi:hypothetical protein